MPETPSRTESRSPGESALTTGTPQRQIAAALLRAIEAMPGAVGRIAHSEEAAFDILGLPERCLTDLIAGTARQQ